MPRQIHLFEDPQRFIVGTVGQPGERTFYLQAVAGPRVVSVALEKAQVSLLAERVDQLLDEAVRSNGVSIDGVDALDMDPLAMPLMEEFRVGAMALGWDAGRERIIVEAHAQVEDDRIDIPDLDDDVSEGPDTLRVRMTAEAGRAFAERARVVVAAGRPPCPFCDLPLDPIGHICPRANGYRRRSD